MQILKTLPYEFSVCQLDSTTSVNFWIRILLLCKDGGRNFFGLPYAPGASATLHRRMAGGAVVSTVSWIFP